MLSRLSVLFDVLAPGSPRDTALLNRLALSAGVWDREARRRLEASVRAVARQARAFSEQEGVTRFEGMAAYRAALDRRLSGQVNLILHHPEFQRLEAAWRGLWHLVSRTRAVADIRLRVMDIAAAEVAVAVERSGGDAATNPLFKVMVADELHTVGGQPFGAFIYDYAFGHGAGDVQVLHGLAKIAAAAHAPLIAAARSTLLGVASWRALPDSLDMSGLFAAPDYRSWRDLRAADESRFVVLNMPRLLGRPLYGAEGEAAEVFAFEENTGGGRHDRYLWINAAYALGGRITEAFATHGWCCRIHGFESGGTVEDLPTAPLPGADTDVPSRGPTEIALSDRRAAELSKAGLMVLTHGRRSDIATFVGSQTLHAPPPFDGSEAAARRIFSARLNAILPTSRFVHYLSCIVRDTFGGAAIPPEAQAERLNRWIAQYVLAPSDRFVGGETAAEARAKDRLRIERPLDHAKIEVQARPGSPGGHDAVLEVRLGYHHEGLVPMITRFSLPTQDGRTGVG